MIYIYVERGKLLMENITNEDEIYNIWLAFIKAKRCLSKSRELELLPYQITPEQASILYILSKIGKTTRADIARLSCRDLATVSGLIKRMNKKGLVNLEKDTNNKRLYWLLLTKTGEEIYQKTTKREVIKESFSSLTKKERKQLKDILEKIIVKSYEQLRKLCKACYP